MYTVWLCQSGARAPLTRRPFGRRVDETLENLGQFPRGLPPLPTSSVSGWAATARCAATSWNIGVVQRLGKLFWQRDCRCCSSRARQLFNTVLLPLSQTACISELNDKTGELIGGDFGVVLVRFRNVGV
jgi:hypothetical protein